MHGFAQSVITAFTSPLGVFALAALDSTLFVSLPFGIDVIVVVLSARLQHLAWIVPLLGTAGATAGAVLTFWMGRKIGEKGLDRYVSRKRLARVRDRVKNKGAIALAALDLIPPPFPFTPFVLAAGALEVDTYKFFVTLAACRMLRFGAEALLAVIYGNQVLRWIRSDLFEKIVGILIVLAVVLTTASLVSLVRRTRPDRHRAAA